MVFKVFLWTSVFLIFYIYIGYTLFLFILSKCIKKTITEPLPNEELPEVTLFIAAWNEHDSVIEKVKNFDVKNLKVFCKKVMLILC